MVGSDLVGPRPFVEVGGGSKVIEAAVPQDGAWRVISIRVVWDEEGRLPADATLTSAFRMTAWTNMVNNPRILVRCKIMGLYCGEP